ncbi:atrial natriuretic peptide receptor 2-like [Paramacrobiotus metropolitanus]|uniref:atrial natriuretic peptide receptor 2-like n=1 Tax=Paramacrobiotus metropolitanus TaxID=2943436 RepID=UPI0024458CAD|nr:atrial natriuretic peptide receptor 2-like [Paramacrobiotus metropolitanus]
MQYNEHRNDNRSDKFAIIQTVVWPSADGRLPPDEPVCGFRGDKCVERMSTGSLTVAVVVPILLVLTIFIGSLVLYVKLRHLRSQYDPLWWRIPEDEVTYVTGGAVSGSKVQAAKSALTISQTSKQSPYSFVSMMANVGGKLLSLKDVSDVAKYPKPDLIEELNIMKTMDHTNLHHFVGIVVRNDGICHFVSGETCRKGTLADVLENELIKLDWFFKNSMIRDLVSGMAYLHTTPFVSHGFLSALTCLIDSRFTLKITDYGISYFRHPSDFVPPRPGIDNMRSLQTFLWRAPELLRHAMPMRGTQKGDVYSFAIILQQIILRSPPYHTPNDPLELSDAEILQEIIANNIPPVRPRVPRSACSNELYELMERCWDETPVMRPVFAKIQDNLRKIVGNVGDNIVDVLLKRMEQYADDLEQKVADQTQQFLDEKNRSEALLSQLLPKFIATQLTKGAHVDPEAFECVTIFFSDIVGFTTIAASGTPMDVVMLLNSLYIFVDGVLEKFDVYKVETIGDAYMVSSGLPIRNGNRHASEIAEMSLDLLMRISTFVVPHSPQTRIEIRAGVNSGPCVAGIVGLKMPRYCLFGDTVNVASRMESTGEPMKIQITSDTRDLLDGLGGFLMIERGSVSIKGKGTMVTHWLLSKAKMVL